MIKQDIIEKAKQIKLLILDVDGVLTDGRLLFDMQGVEYKCFHARDGHGMKLLQKTGVKIAVISGRKSNSVALRMKSLGIQHVYQGFENKLNIFREVLDTLEVKADQTAFIGDDLLDLPILSRVGLPVVVNDANDYVKDYALYCTHLKGGQGAVREVCDLIMAAQGKLDDIIQSYL